MNASVYIIIVSFLSLFIPNKYIANIYKKSKKLKKTFK